MSLCSLFSLKTSIVSLQQVLEGKVEGITDLVGEAEAEKGF